MGTNYTVITNRNKGSLDLFSMQWQRGVSPEGASVPGGRSPARPLSLRPEKRFLSYSFPV